LFVTLAIAGCAYRGALDPISFEPGKRTPLTVALSYDAIDRIGNFTDRGEVGDSYTFSIKEPLRRSLESLLRRHFQHVVDDDPEALDQIDYVVKPSFTIRKIAQRSVSYRAYEIDLSLLFTDPIEGAVLEQIAVTQVAEYFNPGSNTALDILNGLTLLVLAPVIIPTQIQNGGKEANRVLSEAMRSLLDRTDSEIARAQPRLARYARGGLVSPTEAKADIPPTPKSKYDDLLDAVVVVSVRKREGSGFFINSDGFIVTNAHVVGEHNSASIKLRTGESLTASVIDTDEEADLALLRVDLEPSPYIPLGQHKNAGIGTDVIAIGTPFGLEWSVSEGIVSAIRQTGETTLLQTDAAVNKGNSGGPLVNLNTRRVIGVNTFGFKKELSEGLNFAVSVSEVRESFSYLKPAQ
jgi:S1-C subfamily serine protease